MSVDDHSRVTISRLMITEPGAFVRKKIFIITCLYFESANHVGTWNEHFTTAPTTSYHYFYLNTHRKHINIVSSFIISCIVQIWPRKIHLKTILIRIRPFALTYAYSSRGILTQTLNSFNFLIKLHQPHKKYSENLWTNYPRNSNHFTLELCVLVKNSRRKREKGLRRHRSFFTLKSSLNSLRT